VFGVLIQGQQFTYMPRLSEMVEDFCYLSYSTFSLNNKEAKSTCSFSNPNLVFTPANGSPGDLSIVTFEVVANDGCQLFLLYTKTG